MFTFTFYFIFSLFRTGKLHFPKQECLTQVLYTLTAMPMDDGNGDNDDNDNADNNGDDGEKDKG